MNLNPNKVQIGILIIVALVTCCSIATLILVAEQRTEKHDEGQSPNVLSSATHQQPEQIHCDVTHDVAIIGAGIAGSYAAWKLRNAKMNIGLYEYSNRIGGRCHTVKFPGISDINVELGAMRFRQLDHVILNKTVTELGLRIVDFLPHNTDSLYYLRGKHFRYAELPSISTYNLPENHRKSSGQLLWEMFRNFTNVNTSMEGYADVPSRFVWKTLDGIPLYKQSTAAFLAKYMTRETEDFLQDISGFDSNTAEAIAAGSVPTTDPATPRVEGPNPMKTIESGFQSIPETMVKQFRDTNRRNVFRPNKHLKSLEKRKNKFVLSFQPTYTFRGVTNETTGPRETVCASKVLLAIPRLALERLDWDVLRQPDIDDYIKNSLTELKAGKMYFAYDTAWWQNQLTNAPYIVSTTALRQTYDFGVSRSSNKAVLNPSYTSLYTKIWRDALNQGSWVPGVEDDSLAVSNVTIDIARKMLAEVYDITKDDVPLPNYALMGIWDKYPYGASWYNYRPGYIWADAEKRMTKPSASDDVFIISNTFSGTRKQGWTEGALEIVDKVIETYFPEVGN